MAIVAALAAKNKEQEIANGAIGSFHGDDSREVVMHDNKGTPVGCSVDLARQLAADLGVGVELVETSWSQIIPDLLDRQFDAIVRSLWATTVRALVMNVSAMGVRKGDADFLNFLDSGLAVYRDNAWLEERARFWADPANWPK